MINRQKDVQKCRAGPRLEMSRCIRTDRCERRTGMDMYSNSFVRCRGGVFVATAERGIGGKPVAFSGNVVSDWSAVNTAPLAVRSLQSCRQSRVYRDWCRPSPQLPLLLLQRSRKGCVRWHHRQWRAALPQRGAREGRSPGTGRGRGRHRAASAAAGGRCRQRTSGGVVARLRLPMQQPQAGARP